MLYEKAWDTKNNIHSIWINTKDWAFPLGISWFKTSPELFEGLTGKMLMIQIQLLCFSYRIEKWGFNKTDEKL